MPRMLRCCLIFLAVVLAACGSPTPRYSGGPRALADVDGSRFVVFRRGDEMEAYRISHEARPSEGAVLLRAGRAMQALTGCPIRKGSMTGDQAIVRARIACAGAPPGTRGPLIEVRGVLATCVTVENDTYPNEWRPAYEVDCLLNGGWRRNRAANFFSKKRFEAISG